MKVTKFRNFQLLLDLFRRYGKVSQAFLAQQSGLQASTVSNLCKVLRSLGLITADGKGTTTPEGGRPSDVLALQSDFLPVVIEWRSPGAAQLLMVDLAGNVVPAASHQKVSLLIADDGSKSGCRSAQYALYYHQVMAGLRHASVLVFHLNPDLRCCSAAFSGLDGPVHGAHGLAAVLPDPDWSAPRWDLEMEKQILCYTRFLDPALVGLDSPWSQATSPLWLQDLSLRLRPLMLPVSLHVAAHAHASVLGAAWLCQDSLLKELVRADSLSDTAS